MSRLGPFQVASDKGNLWVQHGTVHSSRRRGYAGASCLGRAARRSVAGVWLQGFLVAAATKGVPT